MASNISMIIPLPEKKILIFLLSSSSESHFIAKYSSILPITDYVSDRLITLPMFANLKLDQINFICDTLEEII